MSQLYKLFYKQYGVRRIQTLLSPALINLSSLPRDSLLHNLVYDQEAIDLTKPYLHGYTKRILVDFKEVLTGQKGAPRRKPIQLKTYAKDWLFEHRQFKWTPEHYKLNSDPFTLLINHYGYLDSLYRYVDLPMTLYNKWWNVQDTLWSSVNDIANDSNRNQFVFINIPNELPGFSILKLFATRVTVPMLKIFDSPDKLSLLEFWKWLHPETRDTSVISRVSQDNLNKVNIVFTNSEQQSVVINLGYLNSWIKDQPNTSEFATVMQVQPEQLQKIILKCWMACQVITDVSIDTDETITDKQQDDADRTEEQLLQEEREEYEQDHVVDDETAADDTEFTAYASKSGKATSRNPDSNEISAFKEVGDSSKFFDEYLKEIDDDLQVLDSMNAKKLSDKGIKVDAKGNVEEVEEVVSPIDVARLVNHSTTEDSVVDMINQQAEIGAITAAEYRTLIKDIQQYRQMKDPYGSKQTIAEVSEITPEALQLDEAKITLTDRNSVLDKGMLRSSLQSFDTDYIKNILKKDVINTTGGIQRAGIVIKKHEVEMEHSALGTYENHTLELKPIRGASSIIRFRLPSIEEDGTFVAASNKYSLRKQRVDMPIRKIKPNIVALTSYYGRSFITRGERKANSSLEWILKQINLSVFDDTGHITKVAPANVFDNTIKAPYIYSALSNYYKSLKAGDSTLVFDYHLRDQLIARYATVLNLKEVENNGSVLVGFNKKKEPIVVNQQNLFYTYSNGEYTLLGDIYTVLGLNAKAAPMDFSEIKIFSKAIPVGILLGYYIGFTGLVTLLGVKHTVVDTKRMVLSDNEYSIVFKDKTYIFHRDNDVATLILAGFTVFAKQSKQYELNDFNHRDVYFNLFRDKGLTTIYIREADLLKQLFIDPITESILQDMGEPIAYIPLLIRATELLLQYHHPDSQDMSEMRIRGYERLSGMVYKELVTSIRQFNNRNIVGRSKIEMSPYKVWQAIMTDNTKKMVEDINPIQNLKELEVVTYVGEGGRSKDAMNKATRAYHPTDMGVISEATVDSSDVGVNTYLTPNPNFKSLRGIIKEDKVLDTNSMLSTSANLAVGATNDDCFYSPLLQQCNN